MSTRTLLTKFVYNLLPAVNLMVVEIVQTLDDTGKVVASAQPTSRNATAADTALAIAPALPAMQAQLDGLTAQLTTATAATKAAQAANATLQAQVQSLTAQLAAATASVSTTQNAAQQAAAAVFNALPPGKQALWEPVRDAVDARLAVNDLAGAEQIIATVPEIYEGMEADQQAFLALFASQPQK